MKVLYFDIDGTVLHEDTGAPKPALEEGRFEQLVTEAHFDRIVCVGHIVTVVRQMAELDRDTDPKGIIFHYCRGVFSDQASFRDRVEMTEDSEHRVACIDFATDWWYVDDMAPYYLKQESMSELLAREWGRRVFVPRANGDGSGVAVWLREMSGSR